MSSIETSGIVFPCQKRSKARAQHPVVYREQDGHIVGTVHSKDVPIEFYIDADDLERVQQFHWYAAIKGKYIGMGVHVNGCKKVLLLHNFVMNRFEFPGKGCSEGVDHINRNGLDNRKSNLRIANLTLQAMNRTMKARYLPDGTLLPRHHWYIKPHGLHGERIGVDIRLHKIKWKSTSSKKVSLQDKLQQAMQKYREFCELYPDILTE